MCKIKHFLVQRIWTNNCHVGRTDPLYAVFLIILELFLIGYSVRTCFSEPEILSDIFNHILGIVGFASLFIAYVIALFGITALIRGMRDRKTKD